MCWFAVPQVWRIDVGMSYGVLNRPVQVLEITKRLEDQETIVRVMGLPLESESLEESAMQL